MNTSHTLNPPPSSFRAPESLAPVLAAAETVAQHTGDALAALAEMRRLSLADFGQALWQLPIAAYPALSRLLPAMASAEVQRNWTGTDGATLLEQTLSFVALVAEEFQSITQRPLNEADILDFGCGYGRILRLMYYFTAPSRLVGVDPWDESLRLCRDANMLGHFALSDYVPRDLPLAGKQFDLVYAFSVFTHLSEKTARIALSTLHRHTKPEGALVLTIRPVEYWQYATPDPHGGLSREALCAAHHSTGFAFAPHCRAPIDGDITYGDTSLSLDWLSRNAEGWNIRSQRTSPNDSLQTVIILTPQG